MNAPSPLIDLLGARWDMGAPVMGAVWDRDGKVAGFGLGDGTLAIAPWRWQHAPLLAERPDGGVELHPAGEPPPLSRQGVHGGTVLALAADGAGGFLTGGDDGLLVRTGTDGTVETVSHFEGGWVDLVAAHPLGWRACAVGRRVYLSGRAVTELPLPGAPTAMAFDPAGRHLAMAHFRGVSLWSADTHSARILACPGYPRTLCWSPDGRHLVCGLQENALHGWRLEDDGAIEMGGYAGQPRSLSFSARSDFLATSGAASVVCWRFDPPGREGNPTECGVSGSTVPVTVVACHPVRPLIAAGYFNGAVVLCQPGGRDNLFIRGAGGGAVSSLAWSPDGETLALGNESGEAALVGFPDRLFRTKAAPTGAIRRVA